MEVAMQTVPSGSSTEPGVWTSTRRQLGRMDADDRKYKLDVRLPPLKPRESWVCGKSTEQRTYGPCSRTGPGHLWLKPQVCEPAAQQVGINRHALTPCVFQNAKRIDLRISVSSPTLTFERPGDIPGEGVPA